jgi:membrane protease YdiL (CAAX protease family)
MDSLVLVALMVWILMAHGERPRDVFLGGRPSWSEAVLGLPLMIGALLLAVALLTGIQQVAPWLHTVERNPLQDLIRTPRDIALFGVVVVVAGGIREEVQRAFLLHRFEQWLGGARVGVVVTSASFGVGHLLQGADAAIATAALGAFWAVVYLRRRSAIAPIVSHSGFNLLQLAQFVLIPR